MEGRKGRPRYDDGRHSSDMVVAKDEVPGAKRSAPPYRPATASGRRRVTFCLQIRKRVPSASLSQKCTSNVPSAAQNEGVKRAQGIHPLNQACTPST
jgi:hypothetical protein